MRKISITLALIGSLFALPAQAANFSAKDAAAATIIFTNPGNCTTGCTPIFAWSDSTGANLVAVLTAGADGASNTANGGLTYTRNLVFNGTTWDRWQGAVTVAGVATAANQATGNASLATIATNTGAAIPAGTNLIGKVGIDQTTPGTTNGVQLPTTSNGGAATVKGGVGVVNGGSNYLAVAASQSATVLQTSTGATGDYLSHCTIYPTSTSPGVVTVFDNTNTAANSAILFPGGASSVSNLVPFAVPVGANSINGAWKVTTGTNVSVVCEGKFS